MSQNFEFFIQNVDNKEFLTWDGSGSSGSVSAHRIRNSANNFHVKLIGASDRYYIQRYNNPESHKLQPANGGSEVCLQDIPTSSTPTVWVAEHGPSGSSQSGIKLSTTNSSGTKWYLKFPAFGGEAKLICSAQADLNDRELKFDLISVDVDTIA